MAVSPRSVQLRAFFRDVDEALGPFYRHEIHRGWKYRIYMDDVVRRPIDVVVDLSLTSAGERLGMFLDPLHTRGVYPLSHFTVLRDALIGASRAVWILAPSDYRERNNRALSVLDEMYARMREYFDFIGRTHLDIDGRDRLAAERQMLDYLAAHVAASGQGDTARPDTKEIIGFAADHVFPDTDSRQAIRRLWWEMSAETDMLGWSHCQREIAAESNRPAGNSEETAPIVPAYAAEPFFLVARLWKAGLSLNGD